MIESQNRAGALAKISQQLINKGGDTMKKLSMAASLCSLLVATAALAQTVKVNWQMNAPFSDYRTYAWKQSKNEGSSFYQQWVEKDVDAILAGKGLRRVAADQNPDLYVYYHMLTQEVFDSTTTDDGFGWGGGRWGRWGGWGGWGGPDIAQTTAQPRMMGILAIDLVDVQRKQMVWRGQATEDSVSNTQQGDEKQVQKSLEKMFKQYPPKQQ
jgi:hypothetical protein